MNDETRRYHLLQNLRFLIAPAHECSYLPSREAATLFVDPQTDLDMNAYSTLAELGFRRSGEHIYRPHCPQCKECVSVRIIADHFIPSRSQQRNLVKNSDLHTEIRDAEFSEEHFDLYKGYMSHRHAGSSMDDSDPEHYMRLMHARWCDTRLMEVRKKNRLLAVAIVDKLNNGLSAVYTYFDPSEQARGLGIYSILQQIEQVKTLQLDYLYLGYWIASCEKMAYKNRFSALEYFNGHRWLPDPP